MTSPPPNKERKLNDDDDDGKLCDNDITTLHQQQQEQQIMLKNETITLLKKRVESLESHIRILQRTFEITSESLVATLCREICHPVTPFTCIRTIRSFDLPHQHATAHVQIKPFSLQYLYSALMKEFKAYSLQLDRQSSLMILSIRGPSVVENIMELRHKVQCTLEDVVSICHMILTTVAAAHDIPYRIQLYTTNTSTLFSNICNHILIKDANSGVPILAVNPLMFFIDRVATSGETSNAFLSECLDQLLSMNLMGHPRPFGALTCHNWTRLTWLDSPVHHQIVHHHHQKGYDAKRILNIITSLASTLQPVNSKATTTTLVPESTSTSAATTDSQDSHVDGTGITSDRFINISEQSYSQEKMMDLYVNAVFCSLEGLAQPRTIIRWEVNEKIVVHDAVRMTKETHVWDKVDTVYKGPLTFEERKNDSNSMIYLVSYIGGGSTSKVYRGITQSGYGCVVKMYVPFEGSDDDDFLHFFEDMAMKEETSYKEIYSNSKLDGYVWRETLNNLQCVIVPFFERVPVEQQTSENVINAIEEQVQRFGTAKKMFRKSAQSWRRVGYFHDQIFLFNLGRLIDIDHPSSDDEDYYYGTADIEPVTGDNIVQTYIMNHMARLSNETAKSIAAMKETETGASD